MNKPLYWRKTWARFVQSRRGITGLVILVCISCTAALAPWLAPYDPLTQHILERRAPPSAQHPLGMDELGRDNLSRVIYGARLSLWVGVTAVLLALVAGLPLGIVAGYRGGWVDSLVTSILDVMQAFPTVLLAITVVIVLGRGLTNAMYAIAFAQIPIYARLARVGVLAVKEREYVLASCVVGAGPIYLLRRHILPSCLIPLQTQAMLGIGTAILEMAGLSFLGLGAQPPNPEWGAMLGQGRGAIFAAPHIVLSPGLAIMVTVLGFNLLGDGLRDTFDLRLEL